MNPKRMRYTTFLGLAIVAAVVLAACGNAAQPEPDGSQAETVEAVAPEHRKGGFDDLALDLAYALLGVGRPGHGIK